MKTIAVIGSRSFSNNTMLCTALDAAGVESIVSGGAVGADSLGAAYAKVKGLPLKEYLPEYEKYGRAAPLVRNKTIIENSDAVIAFWDGKSHGTLDALQYARKLKKPVTVYEVSKEKTTNRSTMIGEPQGLQQAWSQYHASEKSSTKGAAHNLKMAKLEAKNYTDPEERFRVSYNYIKEHIDPSKYKDLAGKENVYLVMPSSSGNMFPLALATHLKETFGGDIFEDCAKQKHTGQIKKLYAMEKVFAERQYEINNDKLEELKRGKGNNFVVVDDLVSTGGTIDTFRKVLHEKGIETSGVYSLVMTGSGLMTQKGVDDLTKALSKGENDPALKEKIEAVFHNHINVSFHLHTSINESDKNIEKIKEIINDKYLVMVESRKIDFPGEKELPPQLNMFDPGMVREDDRDEYGKSGKNQMGEQVKLTREETDKILDRTSILRERVEKSDVPEDLRVIVIKNIEEVKKGNLGFQSRTDLDAALDELRLINVQHSIAAIDFRNLTFVNEKLGHERANDVIEEVMSDRVANKIGKEGGMVYRTGGDEYHVVVPYMTEEKLNSLMTEIKKTVDEEVVKKHGFENAPHLKHDGLPTGAANIDFGCADSSNTKDRSEILQVADDKEFKMKFDNLKDAVEKAVDNGILFEYNDKAKSFKINLELSTGANHEPRKPDGTDAESGSHGLHSGRDIRASEEERERGRNQRSAKDSEERPSDREKNTGDKERYRPENGSLGWGEKAKGWDKEADQKDIEKRVLDLTAYAKSLGLDVKNEATASWRNRLSATLNLRDEVTENIRTSIYNFYLENIKKETPAIDGGKKDPPKGPEKGRDLGMDL